MADVLGARGLPTTPVHELGAALSATVREFPLAARLVRQHWTATSDYSCALG